MLPTSNLWRWVTGDLRYVDMELDWGLRLISAGLRSLSSELIVNVEDERSDEWFRSLMGGDTESLTERGISQVDIFE